MKYSAEFKSMCQPWRVEQHPRGWFVTNGVVSFIHGFECNANEHLKQLQYNPAGYSKTIPIDGARARLVYCARG